MPACHSSITLSLPSDKVGAYLSVKSTEERGDMHDRLHDLAAIGSLANRRIALSSCQTPSYAIHCIYIRSSLIHVIQKTIQCSHVKITVWMPSRHVDIHTFIFIVYVKEEDKTGFSSRAIGVHVGIEKQGAIYEVFADGFCRARGIKILDETFEGCQSIANEWAQLGLKLQDSVVTWPDSGSDLLSKEQQRSTSLLREDIPDSKIR